MRLRLGQRPNKNYGFSSGGASPNPSVEEHRAAIRTFLSMVEPTTGYIEDSRHLSRTPNTCPMQSAGYLTA